MESIERGWSTQRRGGCMGIIDKIHNCWHEISVWRKNNPSHGKEKINTLQKALEEVQNDMYKSHEEVVEVSRKLKEEYLDEESYWKHKSRTLWHTCGDRNTKFFHALTKQRHIQNMIIGLYNEDGEWINSEAKIEGVAVIYFHDLFQSTSSTEFDGFLDEVTQLVMAAQNNRLKALASEEEVRTTLFIMHPEKAPDPDEMTALFYQKSWSVIKDDVVNMVNDFLSSGSVAGWDPDYSNS